METDGSSKVSIESSRSSVPGDFDVDYCQIGFTQSAKECFGMAEALLDPGN